MSHEDIRATVVAHLRSVGQSSVPLLAVELLAFAALCVGISFWSIPLAMVIGSVLAFVACEMNAKTTDPVSAQNEESNRNEVIRKHVDELLKVGKNPFKDPAVPMTPLWVTYVDAVTRSVPGPKSDR